jgi:ribose transport system permease protein
MSRGGRLRASILRSPLARALAPLAIVLVLGMVFHQDGAFFAWDTHRAMLREISVHGMLACGMTLVIISGGIDLAVSSVLALAAVLFAWLTLGHGIAAIGAVPLVMAVGLAAGASSGLLVARFYIQPFVATLAVMVFARGLGKQLSGGRKIASAGELPEIFSLIDAKVLGGNLSVVTIVFAVCAVLTWLILSRLRLGRYLYAVGGNREAARLSGVPVRRVLLTVYALSGLFAAIAGICQAAQETHGDPETGMGYELDAIAMVVLGGTSLAGGRGSMQLTLIGALTLGYLQKILSLNAFSTEARLMLTGAIIVAAVIFQKRVAARDQGEEVGS